MLLLLFFNKTKLKKKKKSHLFLFFGHTASNYKLFSISALSTPLPYFHPFLITRFQIPHAIFSSRIRTLLLLLFFNKTKFPLPPKKKTHLFSFFGHTASNYKLFLSVVSYFPSVFQQNPIPKNLPYFHPFLISVIFNFIAVSLILRFPTYSPLIPTIPLLFLVLISFSKPNSKKKKRKRKKSNLLFAFNYC